MTCLGESSVLVMLLSAISEGQCLTTFPDSEKSGENATRSGVFDELRVVWKCGQTLFWVFDIYSQSKPKLNWKRREKIVKHSMLIDQVRYIKIRPKTIDLSTRLWGITTEFVGFIPERSIELDWILIYRDWSIKIRYPNFHGPDFLCLNLTNYY